MTVQQSHWRTTARNVIDRALREGREQGLSGKELLAHVDAAYPFGERRMFPYQQWLSQRRKQCWSLLPESSRRGRTQPVDARLERLETEMAKVRQGAIGLGQLADRGELKVGESPSVATYRVSISVGKSSK